MIFRNQLHPANPAEPIWVFLDGDGNSWLREGRASADPTPVTPIALQLMTLQTSPGLYLSRPCTFGTLRSDSHCQPAVWTVDRYAVEVVASLFNALAVLELLDTPLVIVGYSGGGVLALQLAARLDNALGVLTIAANLDVDRWVEHHGYTQRLLENTAQAPLPMRANLVQLHVFGNLDDNAPYFLAAGLLAQDANIQVRRFSGADHDCCWSDLWPLISADFQQLMETSDPLRARSSFR